MEDWVKDGSKDIQTVARERVRELIEKMRSCRCRMIWKKRSMRLWRRQQKNWLNRENLNKHMRKDEENGIRAISSMCCRGRYGQC